MPYQICLLDWHSFEQQVVVAQKITKIWQHLLFITKKETQKDIYKCKLVWCIYKWCGYWHQRADKRHGNPPQGNQELLVVRDKVGRPADDHGVSKSMECDIFPFSALTLLVGRQEGHPACKNRMLVCWWWWFDWSFAWLKAPVVQLSSPPPSSFASINTG